eukprot:3617067-Pyramimonas_sp.AAC.1
MRAATWSYSDTTARDPTRLAPKSLYFVSDEGLQAIARLLEACERLGTWPDGRVETELVQLSKADGGKRLIALLHTLTRVWGKLRRPLGKRWEETHAALWVWGNRSRFTSSDSAFDLNLE